METKSVAKSVRMTPTVYNYIMGFDGEGFNEKLNNLVTFALIEKEVLISQQQELLTQNKSYKREMVERQRAIHKLDSVLYNLSNIESLIEEYINI